MRSSIILLGPVLSRNKKCRIGYPGGCIIGKRPIDLHLMALGTLGADISEQTFYLDAECSRFQGKDIYFTKSSVGATQQAILAAVMAQGVTKLHNCAKEPEVFWLCRYLRSMGALIKGEETKEIMITGIRNWGRETIPYRLTESWQGRICVRQLRQEARLLLGMFRSRNYRHSWKYIRK